MQQRVMKDLRGDAIAARDGHIGSIKDVYFDDERWAVRYLVVDTGKWLPGRKVLISPASLDPNASDRDAIGANLTRDQVKGAPEMDQEMPVSRLYEQAHADYFRYPYYWTGPYLWGPAPIAGPGLVATPEDYSGDPEAEEKRRMVEEKARTSHLRSASEIVGYRIQATDGELGHVEDFVVNNRTWAIEHMIVDTTDWLPGGQVVVSPSAIRDIDWEGREVRLALTREELKNAQSASDVGEPGTVHVPPPRGPGYRTDMDFRDER